MKQQYEALVLGLGPAGMAAAVELVRAGVKTAVVDDNSAPGGQVYRQPPADFRVREKARPGPRQKSGQRLIRLFNQALPNLTVFNQAPAWASFGPNVLSLIQGGRPLQLGFKKLVVCEGATERVIPFPGWTLPGIMTTGGLQKMVLNQHILPGRRVLLSGSGPLQISVAATLARAGAEIVGLCEAVTARDGWRLIPEMFRQKGLVRESLSYLVTLRRHSIPILRPWAIVAAAGRDRVEEATIARLGPDWEPIPGSERTVAVDVVGLGFGFQPAARLTRLLGCEHVYDLEQRALAPRTDQLMRTSRKEVYAAGDSAGIGGATMAEIQGRLAGVDLAGSLGRLDPAERIAQTRKLLRAKQKAQRYADLLKVIFRPRAGYFNIIDRETVICRCEGVTAGRIWDEIGQGCRSLVDLKPSRVAMGPCQGRMCESIVTELLRLQGIDPGEIGHLHLRPPIAPLPIGVFGKQTPVEEV